MQERIDGQRARHEHLTQEELAGLRQDILRDFSRDYCCKKYRISSRIYSKYKAMWGRDR